MNHPELLSENLSAGYDGQPILSNVSIKIPQNKIRVILGANGCGKSTLLKTFARLLKPEATLKELGEDLEPPVGKSGVNHRLRKLGEMAEKLREQGTET